LEPTTGAEIWRSDGTTVGTYLTVDANPGASGFLPAGWFPYFTRFNGSTYYRADDGSHGLELWMSDGTTVGTHMVFDANPGAVGGLGDGHCRVVANNRLWFMADDGVNGHEPWTTDGTTEGTSLFKDINPTGSSLPGAACYNFTSYRGVLYFEASDGATGYELWTSDGTGANTQLFFDLNPTGDGDPYSFKEFRDRLYFNATDGIFGYELWRTDGTPAGTERISDFNASGDSYPVILQQIGDSLYVTADPGDGNYRLYIVH
jgi:ELWxxDGT repeat protein